MYHNLLKSSRLLNSELNSQTQVYLIESPMLNPLHLGVQSHQNKASGYCMPATILTLCLSLTMWIIVIIIPILQKGNRDAMQLNNVPKVMWLVSSSDKI